MFCFSSLLFVATTLHIHIFSLPQACDGDDISSTSPVFLESLALHDFYLSATPVLTLVGKNSQDIAGSSVIWCFQGASSDLRFLELKIQSGKGDGLVFSIAAVTGDDNSDLNSRTPYVTVPYILSHSVGTSASAVTFITVEEYEWWLPPRLCLAPICFTDNTKALDKPRLPGIDLGGNRYSRLSYEMLPPSSAISCIDFDDGHGIIVLGYHPGEFALLFLVPNTFLLRDGIVHDLPRSSFSSYVSRQPPISLLAFFADSISRTLWKLHRQAVSRMFHCSYRIACIYRLRISSLLGSGQIRQGYYT